MKVTEKDVANVADLANLELSAEERTGMLRDLNSILDYVEKLKSLNTSGVEPMAQMSSPYASETNEQGLSVSEGREDILEGLRKSLPQAEALANAPDSDGEFFRVPKVIER